ncbi:MAG: hypothetical protein KGM43_10595, partial [Planctomycetota bacterium]|nr:hypothetical protein [Planctomycetota bacterium]
PGAKRFADGDRIHYVETTGGERYYDTKGFLGETPTARSVGYCDGKRCARVEYERGDLEKQESFIVSNAFMGEGTNNSTDRPRPYYYYFVGKTPLYEALPRAEHLGIVRFLGRDCDSFLFSNIPWAMLTQNIVYTIDKESGVPLRVASFVDVDDIAKTRPLWSWDAKNFGVLDNHHIVIDSEHVLFGKPGTQYEGQTLVKHTYHVESASFNHTYPHSMFWPETRQSDALFVDSIAKKIEVPKAAPNAKTNLSGGVQAANPIRVEGPGGASAWLTSSLLVVGVSLILTGTAVWWRRRG